MNMLRASIFTFSCVLGLMPAISAAQSFSLADVPVALRLKSSPNQMRRGFQSGGVPFLRAESRQVEIHWQACGLLNGAAPVDMSNFDLQTDSVDGHVWHYGTQPLAVRYYPTAVCVVGDDTLVVAGINDHGHTIIEKWVFVWPQPMPGKVSSPTTGLTGVNVVLPIRQTVKVLYSGDVLGKKYVRNLAPVQVVSGTPTSILVQFHDSSDVYSMALSDGAHTLIAGSAGGGGVLGAIPALSVGAHHYLKAMDHKTLGFIYRFEPGMRYARPGPMQLVHSFIILQDADRDGAIESHFVLSGAGFLSQGLDKLSNYEQWWLK